MMNSSKSYTIEEAKRALEYFCSYQERTHYEVLEKLRKIGMQEEAQNVIIIHLLQQNFLNEERFAKAFVGGKFRIKKWGRIKIRQALVQKGVSQANITIGLQEIEDSSYIEVLQKLLCKLLKNNTKPTYKEKQKIIRSLQLKGYEFGLIMEQLEVISC